MLTQKVRLRHELLRDAQVGEKWLDIMDHFSLDDISESELEHGLRTQQEDLRSPIDVEEERERWGAETAVPTEREIDWTWLDEHLRDAAKAIERKRKIEQASIAQVLPGVPSPWGNAADDHSASEPPLEEVLNEIAAIETSRAALFNLFSEAGRLKALEGQNSKDPIERALANKFIECREQALGKFCYNPRCGKPLPPRAKKRGRPQLYCEGGKCKKAGSRWHKNDQENPITIRLPDTRNTTWTAPRTYERTPPWRRAWVLKLRSLGLTLDDVRKGYLQSHHAGHVFSTEERDSFEEVTGQPLDSFLNAAE